MTKGTTIQEIVDETRQLQNLLREKENRAWTIETCVMELLAEAGTLADSVIIQEGYRLLRPNQTIDLKDDIADVLFVLIMIANHYGISLEDAYVGMLRETTEKLAKHTNTHEPAQ
jgi:NTP pyrophosphatase (non-canonical NTP hydrolase)